MRTNDLIPTRGAAPPAWWARLRLPLAVGGTLLVLVAVVRWGGTARPGPLFALGVALLLGMIVAFGGLTWWLLLSPLPPGSVVRRGASRAQGAHTLLASLVLISGLLFSIGGFWDELWHRRYGGFGDDFLWPPHMLLYVSLGLMALFALGGIALTLRGRGSVRERFRQEPLIGLLGLTSGFLMASLPSDEIWHAIYGLDLTAWSLPHVTLASGFALVMFVSVALLLSSLPRRGWAGLGGLRPQEMLATLLVAAGTTTLLLIGTAEWDGLTAIETGSAEAFRDAFWQRPEWLYPVVVVTIALLVGNLALHALRRAGVATLVGLAVLGFRVAMLTLLGGADESTPMSATAHLLLLPPLVALDLWYARRRGQEEAPATLVGGNLAGAVAALAVGLPLIDRLMVYPRITAATIPPMLVMGLLLALGAGWLGARFGGWLGTIDRPQAEAAAIPARTAWVTAGVLALALAGVALMIITAQPPTA